METHTISDVQVEFPFTPYPCQLAYMEKVLQCLQKGTNAILESPTGTGKTLCLLCATLAWRESLIRGQQLDDEEEMEGDNMWDINPSGRPTNIPRIIYASRTHSQLSQVIHELKNTRYRPRVAIIGSREQLCIHPEVSKKESNSEKVHLCRAKVQSHSCGYYANVNAKQLRTTESVMDIEDLVLAGSRQRMCPYYLARELKSDADVIFMPYNYILDIKTRQMHGIDIQGAVVILDEAHNIERVCEDSASFDLTSTDIAHCIADIHHLLTAKKTEQSTLDEDDASGDDIQDLVNLKQFFLAVEDTLDAIEFEGASKKEMVKPGLFIFDFFAIAGLTPSTCPTLLDQCDKAISALTTGHSVHRSGNNLQKFVDAAKVVFSPGSAVNPQGSSQHYKVFLKAEEAKKNKSDVWTVSAAEASKKETRTLSYWCFSPGHAMGDLMTHGVRSVILTSGTLSPLQSFSSELQLDFPVQFEGPHVISEQQVWVGVVVKGCDGTPLNSSYKNRFSTQYQTSLGNTIVNFSRIVPHGLLVFFPSYPVMYGCMDTWRESGILQRIEQYKPVFQEPRRKADFNPTMDAFYEKISDPKYNGATFFAVCRGKVSEGLDFADVNGRAVIITGLPYPPRMEPKIVLKMKYLEEALKRQPTGLGGEEWYKQQASRAVNQAVGRVIRHRMDYGAIILCDERFSFSNALNQLPRWVRPYAKTYDKFGLVQRDLTQFFRNAEKKFSKAAPKKQQSAGPSTSSLRTPIVVKNLPSYRSTSRPHIQDASLVETHLPSKMRAVPQASLAKLQAESEKTASEKSLLSSLAKCESSDASKKPKTVDVYTPPALQEPRAGPSLSETILQTTGAAESQPSSSSEGRAASKKTMVISKKQSQVSKVASVAGFIAEIQSSLSDEAFQTFKKALGAYKDSHDIYTFTEKLKEIFRHPSSFHLLKGMYKFVHDVHRDTYRVFYCELTGKTLEQTHALPGSTMAATGKRKAPSSQLKDEPKTKLLKPEDTVLKPTGACKPPTCTNKLTLLNSETHLNHGKHHLSACTKR